MTTKIPRRAVLAGIGTSARPGQRRAQSDLCSDNRVQRGNRHTKHGNAALP